LHSAIDNLIAHGEMALLQQQAKNVLKSSMSLALGNMRASVQVCKRA
jgi:hypothetical protein